MVLAQTFNGQGGLLVPPGAPAMTVGITTSIANVSGIGIIGNGCVAIDNVTIDLVHTFDSDLALFIIAPSGQVLELSSSNGGAGDNYSVSVFKDNTPLFITQGVPPYNGTWRPEGRQQNTTPPFSNANPLGTYTFLNTFNGVNANGAWTLMVNDYVAADVGVLNSWSITFISGGGSGVTVDLGPDITICPGQSVTLTPTVNPTPDSYAWNTGQSTSTITVNPLVTTSYSVTVTENGCVDQDTIMVIVNPNAVTANAGPDVSICSGQSTTLTGSGGSGGSTYAWSNGQNGQSISVNPSGTTLYTLTVTDGACSSTDQVIVTVNPLPVADAGPPVSICQGSSTILTATGGTQNSQYTWSTGQNGSSISVSPGSTTTYTVTVNINGCMGTDDVEVTVEPTPVVDAGSPVSICQGESVTLTATGSGGTYEWSNGSFGNQITVSPNATTLYSVTLTANGCDASDNVLVTVTNLVANVSPDVTICEGENVQLTASGGTTYEWSTGATSASIIVAPGNLTIYSVTVSLGNCMDETEVEVDVIPLPIPNVSPDQTICDGETATLVASGGATYAWNSGQNTATISVSPGASTTYTVTVSDQGCSASISTDVNVNPTPNTDAGADMNICDGETITLFASGLSGAGEYAWSTGETGPDIDVMPGVTTTYSVTATNSFDCSASDDVMVIVHPVPVAQAGADQDLCEGLTATLTASGGSALASYQWSNGQSGTTISVSPQNSTTYTVTVSEGGCSDEDDVEVNILLAPIASAGPDQTICAGTAASLTATGGGTYAWSTGASTAVISVSPVTQTSFIVTVTAANGCTDVDSVSVLVQPLPIADAGPDQVICAGDNVTLTGTGGGTYQWSTGDLTPSFNITPANTATYTLTVTDAFGCNTTDMVTITVQPLPVANAGPNVFILSGDAATLNATGGGMYLWSTGETSQGISVSPTVTTIYTVTVTLNGCTATDNVTVFVNEVPDVDLGPDWVICEGETITLDATILGPFMIGYQWSTGETTATLQVSPSSTTQYTVTVTDLQSGFFSIDSVQVTVNTLPLGQAVINGMAVLCDGATTIYTTNPVAGATDYQWTVGPNGSILSGQGSTSIRVLWVGSGANQIQLVVSNDCGALPAVSLAVMVSGPPILIGPITGDLMPCETSTATYNIPSVADADFYQWTVTGGGFILGGQGTNSITVDWNGSTGGDLCLIASNPCGMSQEICQLVMTTTNPVIDAGQDFSVCGLTFQLTGSGSGVWTLQSGQGNASFTDINNPMARVTVSKAGTYTFQLAKNENGCSAMDEVTGVFFDEPVIQNVSEPCSQDHMFYTVTFSITGGLAPYQVTGGQVNGFNFVSSPLPAGSTYSFQSIDANGCVSNTVTGLQDCACFKQSGEMDLAEIQACADETIQATFLGGEFVEPGDTLLYILHDGTLPGGIIAWNNLPEFEFISPMEINVPYFISVVVGAKEANGLVDLTDPCVAISAGTPIRFYAVPEVDLGPDLTVSLGDEVTLNATSASAIQFYNWFTTDTCSQCPVITIHPKTTAIVQVEVSNAEGCSATDQVKLTVLAGKDIDFPNIFSPNGDQINDVLFIGAVKAIDKVESFEIFDRWGNKVFERKDFVPGSAFDGWNGVFNGKRLNPGVYLCAAHVLLANGKAQNFTWDVTLIR